MKFQRTFAWAVVVGCLPVLGWGQSLDQIRQSGTASEAVAAYARALSNAADPTLAQQAFVKRMIDLESPELSAEQAREITLYVNDGQAWAVLAFVDAQHDKIEPALEKITKAVKYSPSNEFVQKTAGEIVAWYDLRDDQATLPEDVRKMAEQLKDSAAARGRAYSKANENATRILTGGIGGDDMGMQVNIVGSLEELGTYSGYTTHSVPGLVSFWNSPYLYPGYSLEPFWVDRNYPGHWAFPQLLLRDVSRDVRYLRMPGNRGFILVDGLGATVVPNRTGFWRSPYYSWQRDPWYFGDGYGFNYGYGYGYGYGGRVYRGYSPTIRFPGRVWGSGLGYTPANSLVWGPGIGGDYYRANRSIGYVGGTARMADRMGPFRDATTGFGRGGLGSSGFSGVRGRPGSMPGR